MTSPAVASFEVRCRSARCASCWVRGGIATVPGVGHKLVRGAILPGVAAGPDLPDTPSQAVLSLRRISPDRPDRNHLVEGIATELIGALTRTPGLFVIAATSSFADKGRAVQLPDVARELGVRE